MREIRPSGSEGGVALTAPSLPLSLAISRCVHDTDGASLPVTLTAQYVS